MRVTWIPSLVSERSRCNWGTPPIRMTLVSRCPMTMVRSEGGTLAVAGSLRVRHSCAPREQGDRRQMPPEERRPHLSFARALRPLIDRAIGPLMWSDVHAG